MTTTQVRSYVPTNLYFVHVNVESAPKVTKVTNDYLEVDGHLMLAEVLNKVMLDAGAEAELVPLNESERTSAFDYGAASTGEYFWSNEDSVTAYFNLVLGSNTIFAGWYSLPFNDPVILADGIYPLGQYTREEYLDRAVYLQTSTIPVEKRITRENAPFNVIESVDGVGTGSNWTVPDIEIGQAYDDLAIVPDTVYSHTISHTADTAIGLRLTIETLPRKVYFVMHLGASRDSGFLARLSYVEDVRLVSHPIGASDSTGEVFAPYLVDGQDVLIRGSEYRFNGNYSPVGRYSPFGGESTILVDFYNLIPDQVAMDYLDSSDWWHPLASVDGGGLPVFDSNVEGMRNWIIHNLASEYQSSGWIKTVPMYNNPVYKVKLLEYNYIDLVGGQSVPMVGERYDYVDSFVSGAPAALRIANGIGSGQTEYLYELVIPLGTSISMEIGYVDRSSDFSMQLFTTRYGSGIKLNTRGQLRTSPITFNLNEGTYYLSLVGASYSAGNLDYVEFVPNAVDVTTVDNVGWVTTDIVLPDPFPIGVQEQIDPVSVPALGELLYLITVDEGEDVVVRTTNVDDTNQPYRLRIYSGDRSGSLVGNLYADYDFKTLSQVLYQGTYLISIVGAIGVPNRLASISFERRER